VVSHDGRELHRPLRPGMAADETFGLRLTTKLFRRGGNSPAKTRRRSPACNEVLVLDPEELVQPRVRGQHSGAVMVEFRRITAFWGANCRRRSNSWSDRPISVNRAAAARQLPALASGTLQMVFKCLL